MNTKSAVLALVLTCMNSLAGEISLQSPQPQAIKRENESLSSALFTLAAERFATHEELGETWVLAVHDWAECTNVVKFYDGQIHLLSIPSFKDDLLGLRRYASAYNCFNIRKADAEALRGHHATAKRIYTVLLKAKTCDEAILKARLSCLEEIDKDTEAVEKLKVLAEEYKTLGSFPNLRDALLTPATVVTNWQQAKLP